jgi:choline dehydrogenase
VRATTVDGYLPLGTTLPNLTIRPDSTVATIEIRGGRATGVRLVDGSVIGANRVVIAAGTYGSPTILLRSGIGPARDLHALGIDVLVDLPGVGANLADHPAVELDTGWRGTATTGPALHTIATLRSSAATPASAPDLMFWISDPAGEEPGFWIDSVLLKPVSRGSVRLRSADPAEPPRITLPSVREVADVERLVEATALAWELANRPEIRQVAAELPPVQPGTAGARRDHILANAYSIPHVVGTCAMGADPLAGAVVDAGCDVHGVEGLSVVDASVMPDAPSGFPHVVTIMLAEHAAARLATRL